MAARASRHSDSESYGRIGREAGATPAAGSLWRWQSRTARDRRMVFGDGYHAGNMTAALRELIELGN